MKLLDKFRSQPEWRSEDPAVRAAAVRDLSNVDAEQELLNEIAHHDDDPSVRLEAVLRLEDVDALASIARHDGDTMVRSEAEGMLRDLAIEAEDLSSIELGLGAVSNERDLVAVAPLGSAGVGQPGRARQVEGSSSARVGCPPRDTWRDRQGSAIQDRRSCRDSGGCHEIGG